MNEPQDYERVRERMRRIENRQRHRHGATQRAPESNNVAADRTTQIWSLQGVDMRRLVLVLPLAWYDVRAVALRSYLHLTFPHETRTLCNLKSAAARSIHADDEPLGLCPDCVRRYLLLLSARGLPRELKEQER